MTGPLGAVNVDACATVRGPDCVIPPELVVADNDPPTVEVPRLRAPPAVVVRFPSVFIVPRVSAFLSAMATEPLMGIGCDVIGSSAGIGLPRGSSPVTVAALTVPPKSLLEPLSVIAPGAVIFNDVLPALVTVLPGA